jgi:hypothetical protein
VTDVVALGAQGPQIELLVLAAMLPLADVVDMEPGSETSEGSAAVE